MKRCIFLLCWGTLGIPLSAGSEQLLLEEALDCVIEPKSTIKIGSKEQGVLENIFVSRGDMVKKGDPLARLEVGLERLTAELAKLRAESDVEIRSSQTQLSFRQRHTDRMHELQQKKSVPDTELDKAQVEALLAQLAVETAENEHQIAMVEYQRATENLERRSIRSPVDGVVVDVMMSPGEYVHEQAQLMTIAAVDPLYVEVYAPVAYYGQITKGTTATVIPEEPVGGAYTAKVTVVDQIFDPASRTFGVRLLMPNKTYHLPAGMRCKVKFGVDATNAVDTDLNVSISKPE